MPAARVSVIFTAGTGQFTADVNKAKATVQDFGKTATSNMVATSAAIRLMEGNVGTNTRALARWLSTVAGIGPILQAAFPIVGLAVFAGAVEMVGEKLHKFFKDMRDAPEKISGGFRELNAPLKVANDELLVTADRLDNSIAKLEGRRQNSLKLELDEARLAADKLEEALQKDLAALNKFLTDNNTSWWQRLFGKASTTELKKELGGETGFGGFTGKISGIDKSDTNALLATYDREIAKIKELTVAAEKLDQARKARGSLGPLAAASTLYLGLQEATDQTARLELLRGTAKNLQQERDSIANRTLVTDREKEEKRLEIAAENVRAYAPATNALKTLDAQIVEVRAKLSTIGMPEGLRLLAESAANANREIVKVNEELVHGHTVLTAADTAAIKTAERILTVSRADLLWGEALDANRVRVNERIASLDRLSAAIGRGYQATKEATVQTQVAAEMKDRYADAQYSSDRAAVTARYSTEFEAQHANQIATTIDHLQQQTNLERTLAVAETQGTRAVQLATLNHRLLQIARENDFETAQRLTRAEVELFNAQQATATSKELTGINLKVAAMRRLIAAQGEEARLAAETANVQVQATEKFGPQVGAAAGREDRLKQALAVHAEADALAHTYTNQLAQLQKITAEILAEGDATNQTIEAAAALNDLRDRMLKLESEALLKQKSAFAGMSAFFVDMEGKGKEAADTIYEALHSALDKISSQFARLFTGQIPVRSLRAEFSKMFQGLGEDLLKNSLQVASRKGLAQIGERLPGRLGDLVRATGPAVKPPDASAADLVRMVKGWNRPPFQTPADWRLLHPEAVTEQPTPRPDLGAPPDLAVSAPNLSELTTSSLDPRWAALKPLPELAWPAPVTAGGTGAAAAPVGPTGGPADPFYVVLANGGKSTSSLLPIGGLTGTPGDLGRLTAPVSAPEAIKPIITEAAARNYSLIQGPARESISLPAFQALALAVASRESGFNPEARNPSSTATGLFQLTRATQSTYGVTAPTNPIENVQAGTQFLAQLIQSYKGDVDKALVAFAGGPGNVQRVGVEGTQQLYPFIPDWLKDVKTRQAGFEVGAATGPARVTIAESPLPVVVVGGAGAKAAGGDVLPGQSYVVGEKGPEVFVPDRAGEIVPNGQAGPALSPVPRPTLAPTPPPTSGTIPAIEGECGISGLLPSWAKKAAATVGRLLPDISFGGDTSVPQPVSARGTNSDTSRVGAPASSPNIVTMPGDFSRLGKRTASDLGGFVPQSTDTRSRVEAEAQRLEKVDVPARDVTAQAAAQIFTLTPEGILASKVAAVIADPSIKTLSEQVSLADVGPAGVPGEGRSVSALESVEHTETRAGAGARTGVSANAGGISLQALVPVRDTPNPFARLVIRSGSDLGTDELRSGLFPELDTASLEIEKLPVSPRSIARQPGRQIFHLRFLENGQRIALPDNLEERLGIGRHEYYHAPLDLRREPVQAPAPPLEITTSEHEPPKLATGGIATSATTAVIGEAGPEAIIPLTADAIASFLGPLIPAPVILANGNLAGIGPGADSAGASAASAIPVAGPAAPASIKDQDRPVGTEADPVWVAGSDKAAVAAVTNTTVASPAQVPPAPASSQPAPQGQPQSGQPRPAPESRNPITGSELASVASGAIFGGKAGLANALQSLGKVLVNQAGGKALEQVIHPGAANAPDKTGWPAGAVSYDTKTGQYTYGPGGPSGNAGAGGARGVGAGRGPGLGTGPTGTPSDPVYVVVESGSSQPQPQPGPQAQAQPGVTIPGVTINGSVPGAGTNAETIGGGTNSPTFEYPRLPGGLIDRTGLPIPPTLTPSLPGTAELAQASQILNQALGNQALGSAVPNAASTAVGTGVGTGGELGELSSLLGSLDGAGEGVGALGGALGSLGAAGGEAAAGAGEGLAEILPEFAGLLADGGDTTPGKTYIVGEDGPEIFQPTSTGTVIPLTEATSSDTSVAPTAPTPTQTLAAAPAPTPPASGAPGTIPDGHFSASDLTSIGTQTGAAVGVGALIGGRSDAARTLNAVGTAVMTQAVAKGLTAVSKQIAASKAATTAGTGTAAPAAIAAATTASETAATTAASTTAATAADSAASSFESIAEGFEGALAGGGKTKPGKTYLVGEKGPEVFRSRDAGEIIPLDGSAKSKVALQDARPTPAPAPASNTRASGKPIAGAKFIANANAQRRTQAAFASVRKLLGLRASTQTGTGAGSRNPVEERSAALLAQVGLGRHSPSHSSSLHASHNQRLNPSHGPRFGGFRADGGDVSPNMSYIVGERQPELFTPRASGSISPVVRGGDSGAYYSIDARGAALGTESRIARGIEISHNSAISSSVRVNHERKERSPQRSAAAA